VAVCTSVFDVHMEMSVGVRSKKRHQKIIAQIGAEGCLPLSFDVDLVVGSYHLPKVTFGLNVTSRNRQTGGRREDIWRNKTQERVVWMVEMYRFAECLFV